MTKKGTPMTTLDPRLTPDMALYWRGQYSEWDNPGKSPHRFVQSLRRIGTDEVVLKFVEQVLRSEE